MRDNPANGIITIHPLPGRWIARFVGDPTGYVMPRGPFVGGEWGELVRATVGFYGHVVYINPKHAYAFESVADYCRANGITEPPDDATSDTQAAPPPPDSGVGDA